MVGVSREMVIFSATPDFKATDNEASCWSLDGLLVILGDKPKLVPMGK